MTFERSVGASIRLTPGPLLRVLGLGLAVVGCEDARSHQQVEPRDRAIAQPAPVVTPAPADMPGHAPVPSGHMDSKDGDPIVGSGGGAQSPPSASKLRFAALGDYGSSGKAEQQVAELVLALQLDFVITTGDNNYPGGAAATIDENIGQYYGDLIHPYKGGYGSSATENRFFPTLGNHDWVAAGAQPYLDYFTLPGNERYYDIVRGNVHFFAIDSDVHEPDGIVADSVQAQWLKRGLAASTSAFDVVAMHHPPYSSGPHGSTVALQWPYAAWGAEVVFAGHDHCYERLEIDGATYVVSGLGGRSIYSFGLPVEGSLVRYNDQYGITVVEADANELQLSFVTVDGELIDSTKIAAH